ncbi:MAG: class I SAM-dependent methyltransferase [Bdellovibrionales bacterium]
MRKCPKIFLTKVDKIEGWLSHEVCHLLYHLGSDPCLPLADIIEIGAWKGKSTKLLCSTLRDGEYLYSIDPHTGSHEHHHMFGEVSTFEDFTNNLSEELQSGKIIPLKNTSQKAISELSDNSIKLLWIDGSHDYEDVYFDLLNYSQLVIDGGWIAMHDYKWSGVKKVVWEEVLLSKKFSFVRRVEDTHYFRKREKTNVLAQCFNFFVLQKYKISQDVKRLRRRWRKIHNQRTSN